MRLCDFDIPSSLEPVLREYQKRGYLRIKTLQSNGFCGILADDMGLGRHMIDKIDCMSILVQDTFYCASAGLLHGLIPPLFQMVLTLTQLLI